LIQLIVLYVLAVGIQSFRGSVHEPGASGGHAGSPRLHDVGSVQQPRRRAIRITRDLAAIIAAFGFGANFTLADPVLKMIFKNSGGAPPMEPEPVVFPPEPVMSPIVESVAEPVAEPEVQTNKITNTNSNGRQ
jgi:hypothetical protein